MWSRPVRGLPLLLLIAACRFDSGLPDGAVISCSDDQGCLQGQRCQGGLCVDQGVFDSTPPALEGPAMVSYLERAERLPKLPQALGPRSLARVSFQTTEPVAPPTLAACDGVSCSLVESAGLLFSFSCSVVADTAPPASCPLSVTLVDLARNRAAVPLPELTVDVDAPAALPVDTDGQVLLTRVPWGAERSPGQSQLVLEVSTLAADEALVTYDSAAVDAPTLQVGDFGQTRLVSMGVDRPELFAAVFDRAGNQGPIKRVRDVVLVASPGSVSQGSANPNRFLSSPVHAPGYARPDLVVSGQGQGVEAPGGAAVSTQGGGVWRQRFHLKSPRPLYVATTYDAARARVVAYGGCNCVRDAGLDVDSSLQEWNGESWQPISPHDFEGDGNPPGLVGAAMAWDARRETVVMFGGFTGQKTSNDTWLWNGVSWTKASPAQVPPARQQHAMAFDARRRQVLMFGGLSADGGLLGDTWLFDGLNWNEVASSNPPGPRVGHSLTYDPNRQSVLLTGGLTPNGLTWGGWRFDGASWVADPSLAGLAERSGHGTVFDSERDQLLVFGGQIADGGVDAVAWAQTAAGWAPLDAGAFPRAFGQVVFDGARRATVVHGGVPWVVASNPANQQLSDFFGSLNNDITWSVDLQRSTVVAKSTSPLFQPQARVNHSMAWNPQRGVTVIQGGEYGPNRYDDTSEWDGVRWAGWGATLPSSGARTYHTMGFEPVSGQMLMFGGLGEEGSQSETDGGGVVVVTIDAGTWLGNPDAGWVRQPFSSPPDRLVFGMTTVPGLGLVLAGGSAQLTGQPRVLLNGSQAIFSDAWHFDGAWRKLPSTLGNSVGSALAFDAARGKVVLMPGIIPFQLPQVISELDVNNVGAGWVTVPSVTRPPLRAQENLLYDTSRQRVLHYGAPLAVQDPYSSDRVWEWDGTNFQEALVSNAEGFGEPGSRSGFRWAYDERRQRAVLFGGINADVWELETGNRTPGHIFELALEAAQVPMQAEIRGLDVSAIAGADSVQSLGDGGFAPVAGLMLLAWQDDGWSRPLAQSNDAQADAGRLSASLSAAAAGRLSGAERVRFALTPRGITGPTGARLTTDYVEATVHYRLPAQP